MIVAKKISAEWDVTVLPLLLFLSVRSRACVGFLHHLRSARPMRPESGGVRRRRRSRSEKRMMNERTGKGRKDEDGEDNLSSPARLPQSRRTARPRSGIYVAASRSSSTTTATIASLSGSGSGSGFPTRACQGRKGRRADIFAEISL